jgi:prepilin-type N-terminal cleavage/methylation domain-containing protein
MSLQAHHQRGFTLLETLIVTGIVTVMTAALIPNINTAIQNYRLNASAQEIASQIQSARYRALRSNGMSTFLVLASNRQFGIDMNGDGNLTSGTTDVLLNLNSNVSFADLSTPPTPMSGATTLSNGTKTGIGFTPRATLTAVSTSGTPDFNPANLPANGFAIYLANTRSRFLVVTVNPTGRVRTWSSGDGINWQ